MLSPSNHYKYIHNPNRQISHRRNPFQKNLKSSHFLFLTSSYLHISMSFLVLILIFMSTLHAHQARPLASHSEGSAQSQASHLGEKDIEKKIRLFDSSSPISRLEPRGISMEFQTDQVHRFIDKNRSEKTPSSEIDWQEGIKIKAMKRQRKLMMEDANDTEKVVEFKEREVGEDMAVMDYAQPHRKPPIHNEKP